MKDWLGQEYAEGDTIVYAAGSGRSITMVLAKVVKFNDSGSVTVQPVKSSRWEQHSTPTWYIDSRTGKKIDAWKSEHIESGGNYLYPDGTASQHGQRVQTRDGTWVYGYSYDRRDIRPGSWEYGQYQTRVLKDYVKQEFGEIKAVTLKVTANITKWTGEVPDAD